MYILQYCDDDVKVDIYIWVVIYVQTLYNNIMINGVEKVFDSLDDVRRRVVRLKELDYVDSEWADGLMPDILSLLERVGTYMQENDIDSEESIKRRLVSEGEKARSVGG